MATKMTRARVRDLLTQETRFLYLTHGAESCYQIHGVNGVVPRRMADEITGNLFSDEMVTQRKGEQPLIPQEDGLFPGFSQTWRMES